MSLCVCARATRQALGGLTATVLVWIGPSKPGYPRSPAYQVARSRPCSSLSSHAGQSSGSWSLLRRAPLRDAVRSLHPGAAADALGWHHEALVVLSVQEPFLLLTDLLQLCATRDLGTMATDVINSSLLPPLCKGPQGGGFSPSLCPQSFASLVASLPSITGDALLQNRPALIDSLHPAAISAA